MKYLGIDYGKKRVGIAISDEGGMMAFPFIILQNDIELYKNIENICKEEKIDEIVLGESKSLTGQDNKIMKDINEFKNKLNSKFGHSIHLEKEFMTTIFAREEIFKQKDNTARKVKKVALSATHQRGGKNKNTVDASAAALILQRFLDRENMGK